VNGLLVVVLVATAKGVGKIGSICNGLVGEGEYAARGRHHCLSQITSAFEELLTEGG